VWVRGEEVQKTRGHGAGSFTAAAESFGAPQYEEEGKEG